MKQVRLIKVRFQVSIDQINKFVYTGMSIKAINSKIMIDQSQYSQELPAVPKDVEQGKEDQKRMTLRGMVGKLLCLNLTCPDLSFRTNLLTRIPAGTDLNGKKRRPGNWLRMQKELHKKSGMEN